MVRIIRNCINCQAPIVNGAVNQDYCKPKCRKQYHYRLRKIKATLSPVAFRTSFEGEPGNAKETLWLFATAAYHIGYRVTSVGGRIIARKHGEDIVVDVLYRLSGFRPGDYKTSTLPTHIVYWDKDIDTPKVSRKRFDFVNLKEVVAEMNDRERPEHSPIALGPGIPFFKEWDNPEDEAWNKY